MVRLTKILIFVIFLFVWLASLPSEAKTKKNTKSVLLDNDTPLAVVNGDIITVRELLYVAGIEHRREDLPTSANKPDLRGFLDKLIRDKLIIQEAKEMGLDTNPWLEAKLKEFTVTAAVRKLYNEEILSKVKKVKEKELKKFYEDYFVEYKVFLFESSNRTEVEMAKSSMLSGNYTGNSVSYRKLSLLGDNVLWNKVKDLKPGMVSEVFDNKGRFLVVKLISIEPPRLEYYEQNKLSVKEAYERFLKKKLEEEKLRELKLKYKDKIFVDNNLIKELEGKEIDALKNDDRVISKVGDEILRVKDITSKPIDRFVDNWIAGRVVDLEALSRGYHLKSPLKEEIENYKNQLLKRVFISVVVVPKVNVDDTELKKYYEKIKSKFKEEDRFKILRIVVKEETVKDRILRELKEGADFSYLASIYSIDEVSRNLGGLVGWLTFSSIPESYRKSFEELAEGKIGVLKDGPHWVILKIAGKVEGSYKPFELVKDTVRGEYMAEKIEEILNEIGIELKKTAKIKVYEDRLKLLEKKLFM